MTIAIDAKHNVIRDGRKVGRLNHRPDTQPVWWANRKLMNALGYARSKDVARAWNTLGAAVAELERVLPTAEPRQGRWARLRARIGLA